LTLNAADDQRRFEQLSAKPSGKGVRVTTNESSSRPESASSKKTVVNQVGKLAQGKKNSLNSLNGGADQAAQRSLRWVETIFSDPHRKNAEVAALDEELKQLRILSDNRVKALLEQNEAAGAASQRRQVESAAALDRSKETLEHTEAQLKSVSLKLVSVQERSGIRERELTEEVERLKGELRAYQVMSDAEKRAVGETTSQQEAVASLEAGKLRDEVRMQALETAEWQGRVEGLENQLKKAKGKAHQAENRMKTQQAGFQADFTQFRKELSKLIDRVTKIEKRRRTPLKSIEKNQTPKSRPTATEKAWPLRERPGSLSLRCGTSPSPQPEGPKMTGEEEAAQVATDLHGLTCKLAEIEARVQAA